MNLADKIRKMCEETDTPSRKEQATRNSIPDARTLPARVMGYSYGQRDEYERLNPLLELVPDMAALIIHALHNGYLGEGSTHGWANEILTKLHRITDTGDTK